MFPAYPKPERNRNLAYLKWIKENYPCEINDENCTNYLQTAHFKSGAGDEGNVICLCGPAPFGHHGEQHTKGIKTFQKKYNFDFKKRCLEVLGDYETRNNG